MKSKLLLLTILIGFISCQHAPKADEFLTNMYNQQLYQDYAWLESHCTSEFLSYLQAQYEYECEDGGPCYAVWCFRTDHQDGDGPSHILSIEDEGDGFYVYHFLDMGWEGTHRIHLIPMDTTFIISSLAPVAQSAAIDK